MAISHSRDPFVHSSPESLVPDELFLLFAPGEDGEKPEDDGSGFDEEAPMRDAPEPEPDEQHGA